MMPISPESRKRLLKQTPIIVRAETDEHTPTSLTRVLVRVPLHTVSAGATAGRRKSLPGKRQCHSCQNPSQFHGNRLTLHPQSGQHLLPGIEPGPKFLGGRYARQAKPTNVRLSDTQRISIERPSLSNVKPGLLPRGVSAHAKIA